MDRVLLSGSSGFLGNIILKYFDDGVSTIGRSNCDYNSDLSLSVPHLNSTFDLVIHAAGKAHIVPKTEAESKDFFDVNVTGTKNLLLGLEKAGVPKSFVFISTVAVYGLSIGLSIDENSALLARDPYGLSKIQAEQIVRDWCKQHGVICTILRLPLLAGPNPPGNLKAMLEGIAKGYYFNIAGGEARKSIVLAKDVAHIIPRAAQVGGVFNLTDGQHPSFRELSQVIAKQLNKKEPPSIPYLLAKPIALAGDLIPGNRAPINSSKLGKITSNLTFKDDKARKELGWEPTPVLMGFNIY